MSPVEATAPHIRRGRTEVRWLDGALWVRHAGGGVLIDAPAGVDRLLAACDGLTDLRAIVVSGNRMRAVAGLLGVWDAVTHARGRRPSLHILHPLQAERVSLLGGAWERGWDTGVLLDLDGAMSGEDVELTDGCFVRFLPLSMSEDSSATTVRPVVGCGVRLTTPDLSLAWAPSARPGTAVRRLCAGADLAVVEVGVRPWPPTDGPWRLTEAQAVTAAADAREGWLVGDDGSVVTLGELPN